MAFSLLRRITSLGPITNSFVSSQCSKFTTPRTSPFPCHERAHSVIDSLHLSPLYSETGIDDMKDCKIKVMDDAAWRVSSGLVDAWRDNNIEDKRTKRSCSFSGRGYDDNDDSGVVCSTKADFEFSEIEDMRVRGNLFYKLDKDSKEYEEYKFDFHGKKSARNEKNRKENPKKKDTPREIKKTNKESERKSLTENYKDKHLTPRLYEMAENYKDKHLTRLYEMGDLRLGKTQRTQTFNQLTLPYHEPFCLDIYISTSSVRACIIHRATSKVVAVSHSISKDMRFDLGSTKNRSACGAVGRVLAQRALEDDIHNVVYTPRKGEKLEGKLQVVLRAVVDGGVNVKVKLKQRKPRQARGVRLGSQYRH